MTIAADKATLLKACPFCGKQPETVSRDTTYVRCVTPNCSLQGMGMWSVYGWNTRANSAAVDALVKAATFALTTPGMIKGRDELAAALAAVAELHK